MTAARAPRWPGSRPSSPIGRYDHAPMRLTALFALFVCAVLVAGCGNRVDTRTVGETEGLYLDVDELKYQIQMSRYLNPADIEDRTYLTGLPPDTPQPGGDETWFAIFLRVSNSTDKTITPANDFEIVDTQDKRYRPIPLDASVNPFAFEPNPIPPNSQIPQPDSIASEGVIKQGALLLFKLKTDTLQNRPLELRFRRGSGTTGIVDIDV
jgi:hypothetical protein